MIRSTIFAAQRQSSVGRFALEGAQLTIGPEGLRLIATDGFRLISLHRADLTQDEAVSLLIPRHSLNTIARVFNRLRGIHAPHIERDG